MLKKVTMKTINAIYFVSKGCKLLPCVALALQKVDQARAAKKKNNQQLETIGNRSATGVQAGSIPGSIRIGGRDGILESSN